MSFTPNSAAALYAGSTGYPDFPAEIVLPGPGERKIKGPRPEWTRHVLRWRWLLDSWEGGEAYRLAEYGRDLRGLPIRNLKRHKREYPDQNASLPINVSRPPGSDPLFQADDDDYQLRLARTPVPTFVAEAVSIHLARIYAQEVQRNESAPAEVKTWWENVDGLGTSVDDWMRDTVAPLLAVLGQLDLVFEHPSPDPSVPIRSRADELALRLDDLEASYILPENMPWWKMDRRGEYLECLVREECDGETRWRYWDRQVWCLYDCKGKPIPPGTPSGETSDSVRHASFDKPIPQPHSYGCVPIVRVFDRKRPRSKEIGLPRYEAVAELQREFYNRDSELILSDTTQAHPLLQGPEDFVQADGTIPIGPSWLLPKKKNSQGGSATYEGFEVVDFPKGGADSLRSNKTDLRDAADRSACLTKPAGAAGTDGNTVSQSGVSKRLDAADGNTLLTAVAGCLERCEKAAVGKIKQIQKVAAKPDASEVVYPREFDLYSTDELADAWAKLQTLLSMAGAAPELELALGRKLIRLLLPGAPDKQLAEYDTELEEYLASKAEEREQAKQLRDQQTEAIDADQADPNLTSAQVPPQSTSSASPPPKKSRRSAKPKAGTPTSPPES